MAKRPSFQFYPGDERRDLALQSCSLAARGLWHEMICLMHDAEPYGHLVVNGKPLNAEQLARLVGITREECESLLSELDGAGVPGLTPDGTYYSRRMVRDEDLRLRRAAGGSKGGNPQLMKGRGQPADGEPTWQDIEPTLTGPLTAQQIELLIPELISRGFDVRAVVSAEGRTDPNPEVRGKVNHPPTLDPTPSSSSSSSSSSSEETGETKQPSAVGRSVAHRRERRRTADVDRRIELDQDQVRSDAIEAMAQELDGWLLRADETPQRLRSLRAAARGIIEGDDRTAWQSPEGAQVSWPDRPRLFKLALDRVSAGTSLNIFGALKYVIPNQLDPFPVRRSPIRAGSEAAAVGADPSRETPGRSAPPTPPDPLEQRRQREQEEDQIIAHWVEANPAAAALVEEEVERLIEAERPHAKGPGGMALLDATRRTQVRHRMLAAAKKGPAAGSAA